MLTLRELVKDRKVYSIDAASTVLEAARFMMEHNIGALPVLRNGELAGIFSERDIMNRVVAVGPYARPHRRLGSDDRQSPCGECG